MAVSGEASASAFERCFASELPEEMFEPLAGTSLRLRMLDAADACDFERRLTTELEQDTYGVYLWLIARVVQAGTLGGRGVPETATGREQWLRAQGLTKPVFEALSLECLRVSGYGAALGN